MKTENVNKLTEQYKIVNEIENEAIAEFRSNLAQLFEDNPTLLQFKIRINNHEFNDGDATSFSIYYEDVEVTDADGNIFERNDYGSSDPDRNRSNPLVNAVYDLFSTYDTGNLHERLFGDEYDYIEVSRHNAKEYLN